MKVLCVAEKNSIGKSVSTILGGGRVQTRDSTYKYVKNYEFTFDFPELGHCHVIMTSVAGHLKGIDFPENFGWNKCIPGRLFEAPITDTFNDNQRSVAKNIENLSKDCDKLMIWTDCDREGEYIGYEILQVASKKNNRLTLENTWRAQFSHLERSHIYRAAKNPIKLDKKAIDAVRTRMELDLRTGAAFTRFLCGIFRKYQEKKILDTVSYGSCQFPTLGFVVDRYKRYITFKSEDFWFLDVSIKKNTEDKLLKLSWDRTRLFDRLATVVIYKECMKSDKAKVTNIKSAPTKKFKPYPLTTVQLQKSCSLYFKMSAKESLASAERLYQAGFISYPRTETDIFPSRMDLKELIQKQTQDRSWGEYAKDLLENNKYAKPHAGKHDDKAHPPIHPVLYTSATQIQKANDKKVYEFIVRHFLASCSQDAKGQTNSVELTWGTEQFSTSGLTVLERNFLEVYPYQKWNSSKELPQFTINEEIKLHSAEVKSGKTSPPTLMTETELIALMDANGIGTDATIAEHIEKILTREYIKKETKARKQILVPTILGMSLVDGFDELKLKNSLTKPFLRRNMEEELKKICEGQKSKDKVTEEMIHLYRDSYASSQRQQNVILESYQNYRRRMNQEVY